MNESNFYPNNCIIFQAFAGQFPDENNSENLKEVKCPKQWDLNQEQIKKINSEGFTASEAFDNVDKQEMLSKYRECLEIPKLPYQTHMGGRTSKNKFTAQFNTAFGVRTITCEFFKLPEK